MDKKFDRRNLPERPKGATLPTLLKIVLNGYNKAFDLHVGYTWDKITNPTGTHKEEFIRQIFWYLTYKHFGYNIYSNGFTRKMLAYCVGKEAVVSPIHADIVIEDYLAKDELTYNPWYAKIIKAIEVEIIKLK